MDEEFVFCGTNIFKQLSDWLSGYDGLMSAAELVIEGLFLFFVLKEFVMTKENFEWIKKDRREEKTIKAINYFGWFVVYSYMKRYKLFLDKKDKESLFSMVYNEKTIDNCCKDISDKCLLPISFCQDIIKPFMERVTDQLPATKLFNAKYVYDQLVEQADAFSERKNVFKISFIKQRKKYFKSDDEIDEIYEKLTNIEL